MKIFLTSLLITFTFVSFTVQAATLTCKNKKILFQEDLESSEGLYILKKVGILGKLKHVAQFYEINSDIGRGGIFQSQGKNEDGGWFELKTGYPHESEKNDGSEVREGTLTYKNNRQVYSENVVCIFNI